MPSASMPNFFYDHRSVGNYVHACQVFFLERKLHSSITQLREMRRSKDETACIRLATSHEGRHGRIEADDKDHSHRRRLNVQVGARGHGPLRSHLPRCMVKMTCPPPFPLISLCASPVLHARIGLINMSNYHALIKFLIIGPLANSHTWCVACMNDHKFNLRPINTHAYIVICIRLLIVGSNLE
jgi:hypothetical protein